jgi:oligopeptidase B
MRTALPLACTLALAAAVQAQVTPQAALRTPTAEKRMHVDTMHGDVRRDDYFWLRNKQDPAVKRYLEAENAFADQAMSHLKPLRERLYQEMLGRIKQTDLSVPYRRGSWLYYTRTEEGKQYPIFARKASESAPEQLLLDVNEMAKGQTFMSIGNFQPSDDATLLAYSFDSTGYRQYALRIKDLRTGAFLPDAAARVTSVAWAADNRTLFYTVEDSVTKRSHRFFRHVLGTPEHTLLYEEKDERFSVYVYRTRSREYLMLGVGSLTTGETRYLRADQPTGEWKLVSARRQNREYDVDHRGDTFYIRVNDTGRNFRLVTAPASDPAEANWKELIAHRDDVMLEGTDLFRDHLLTYERKEALPHLIVRDLRTQATHEIAFPEPVYSAFPSQNAEFETKVFRYSYQSFVTPSSVYDYDMEAKTSTLLKQQEVLGGYDKTQYMSERVWATATDGTRIPISVVYRRGLKRDGAAPMLLYAYGSYGAPSSVSFSSNRLSLLDRGFVYALSHIRGGGDLGKAWHDQGRMKNKINTFTDFIASAEHLLVEKYSAKERLVISGGSAGGLLMGAVTNMRPDLFKAVIADVPFVDVINTMSDETLPLTVGEFEEWGNPKKKDEYEYMKQYDPYVNVGAKNYPAMLINTSFNDSQVMYHEPAKWTAKLRAMKTDQNPLLLYTNMGAGHGGASGRYDRLKEIAKDYAFMLWQTGFAEAARP